MRMLAKKIDLDQEIKISFGLTISRFFQLERPTVYFHRNFKDKVSTLA
jgi:hypothetical protein